MTYGTVMVTVDTSASSHPRIRLAAHLAEVFEADLLGVCAQLPLYLPTAGGSPVDAYVTPHLLEASLDGLAQARATFEKMTAGWKRTEWASDIDSPLCFVLRQAARAGLVVTGRHGRDPCHAFLPHPGDLAMNLGRPMLVVPPEVDHLEARCVAIGWRNTREARRAVSDALPFLKIAAKVIVITIAESGATCDSSQIVRYLEGLGIEAATTTAPAEGAATSAALVDLACEHAADLLVTGAYGHSRLREWAFGGVTADLLRGCPICCLLSH